MPHPLCELCGERPAIVIITQIVDNTTTRHHFCEHCARERAQSEGWPLPLGESWDEIALEDVIMNLFNSEFSTSEFSESDSPDSDAFESDDFEEFEAFVSPSSSVDLNEFLLPSRPVPSSWCPHCNTTWDTIKSEGRAGCAACYDAFRDQLGDVLERVQRGETHLGKLPRAAQKRARRLEQLRKRRDHQLEMLQNRLKEAVASEKYEDAAKLRDQIKIVGATVVGG